MGVINPNSKTTNEHIVSGEVTLDGTNPTPVITGLDVITGVALTQLNASAPALGTSLVTYATVGGTLNIYGWEPTDLTLTTLVASTDAIVVGWMVTGY